MEFKKPNLLQSPVILPTVPPLLPSWAVVPELSYSTLTPMTSFRTPSLVSQDLHCIMSYVIWIPSYLEPSDQANGLWSQTCLIGTLAPSCTICELRQAI